MFDIYNLNMLHKILQRSHCVQRSLQIRQFSAVSIPYLRHNFSTNNDKNINLILLKKIGKTTKPGSYKITLNSLKKIFKDII